ncbi:MAG: hypothetical protein MUF48_22415 [Pirellulaceae bacterium]|jgi:hypothetical protein|nr:hypothetical protein [Pirellulaceae bacterium]
MSVRITTIGTKDGSLVKIDGWLHRVDVDELMRLVSTLEGPVALDLTDLQSADRDAVGVLRDLLGVGVELRAASPYIELLLRPDRGL